MFALLKGVPMSMRHPHPRPVAWTATGLALLLATVASGCAARSEYPTANVGAPYGDVAQAPAQPPATAEEMEDDGLPVQRPPLAHSVRHPDDPNEPFSRNYGAPPGITPRVVKTASRAASVPDDLPPDFRSKLVITAGAD